MKSLILFILITFTLAAVSHATPEPVRAKSSGIETGATTSAKKPGAAKKTKVTTQKYKVRSGDNLSTIARRHGMKVAALQRLNGLQDSRLKIGQILLVAGKKPKAEKVRAAEFVEEAGRRITQIAVPDAGGHYTDSLEAVGVEPIARTYLSIPYRYGAESRKSTDCSGFVQQVFREFDIKLPRTAREQFTVGMKVDRTDLASGDLLFFRTRAKKSYPTHVGIYLGNGKMIHASSRSRKVVISDVNHPYYVKRYVGAKRTATFLPGEIDLEMLARQVTGTDDAPLAAAIAADVTDEISSIFNASETTTAAASAAGGFFEAGHDLQDEEPGEEGDDFDNDIEPESEEIVPALPHLGLLPLPAEAFSPDAIVTTNYATTAVSAQR